MKPISSLRFGCGLLAGALLLSTVTVSFADDSKPASASAAAPAAGAQDEMMKKMQEMATPGAGHKVLESLAGDWDIEAKMWMGGEGGQVSNSKGTSKVQWILGKRYLQEEHSGDMMGMPFQGMGITGYDNFRKRYISSWIDSMGTGMYFSEGNADAAGKTITMTGKMDEPTTGEKDKPTKMIIRILSADKHILEMHDLTLGDKSKVFEMTYTRKK